MTRSNEGHLKITPRDLVKNPALILIVMLGLGGTGTGIMSSFSLATKADVAKIETKIDALSADVSELKIEARAREIAEAKKVTATH